MGDSDGDEDGGGVDGDDSGGNSPSRQGAGTETSVPRIGVSRWRRRPWSLSGVSSIRVEVLGHEGLNRRRGGVGRALVEPHHRGAPPPWPRRLVGWAPWLLSGPSSVLWKLPGKIRYWALISSDSENISFVRNQKQQKTATGSSASCQ